MKCPSKRLTRAAINTNTGDGKVSFSTDFTLSALRTKRTSGKKKRELLIVHLLHPSLYASLLRSLVSFPFFFHYYYTRRKAQLAGKPCRLKDRLLSLKKSASWSFTTEHHFEPNVVFLPFRPLYNAASQRNAVSRRTVVLSTPQANSDVACRLYNPFLTSLSLFVCICEQL